MDLRVSYIVAEVSSRRRAVDCACSSASIEACTNAQMNGSQGVPHDASSKSQRVFLTSYLYRELIHSFSLLTGFAMNSRQDDRIIAMDSSMLALPQPQAAKPMMETGHSTFPHSTDAAPQTPYQGVEADYNPAVEPQSTQTRVPILPALPLLRFVAESAMNAQRRLLKLVLLPPKLLDDALRADPGAVVMLGFPLGTEVTTADLIDRIKHLQYTALQALLAAYRCSEARVDVKDKVVLGLEIGRLALDMLSTLQSEMICEERSSSKRKRPIESDANERADKARKNNVRASAASPHTNPVTPTISRNKTAKPSPLRRTSSTREDFTATAHGATLESDADLLIMQRKNARKQEGSRLLKETEDILSSAVSSTFWISASQTGLTLRTRSPNLVQSRCQKMQREDLCCWIWS